jgi:hypothetical protein
VPSVRHDSVAHPEALDLFSKNNAAFKNRILASIRGEMLVEFQQDPLGPLRQILEALANAETQVSVHLSAEQALHPVEWINGQISEPAAARDSSQVGPGKEPFVVNLVVNVVVLVGALTDFKISAESLENIDSRLRGSARHSGVRGNIR